MKLFKRLRGFLRRKIPFLQKKKKVTSTINDFEKAEVSEVCEDVAENCNAELDAPVLSEKQGEDPKSGLISGNEVNFNDNVSIRSDENTESPPKETLNLDCTLPVKRLKKESNDNVGATITFKEEDKEQSTKNDNIFHNNRVVSADLFSQKHLDNDHEDHNCLSAPRLQSCDDDCEKSKENLEFFPEKIEIVDNVPDQDSNSEFEVDFEKVFGPNIQDEEDAWCQLSSKQIQNFVHSSEEIFDRQLALENEKEFDADFDDSIIYRKRVSYPASEGFEYSGVDELYESLFGEIFNVELDTSLISEKASGMIKEEIKLDNKNKINLEKIVASKNPE